MKRSCHAWIINSIPCRTDWNMQILPIPGPTTWISLATDRYYQYINRTSTVTGAEKLAGMLTGEPADIEVIRTRQGIIEDLKNRIDFRQDFTARGHLIKEEKGRFPGNH